MQSSTSSTNTQSESAGCSPEQKSTFENISQFYTGLESAAATVEGYFNRQSQQLMTQSLSTDGQLGPIAASMFGFATLAELNDLSKPSFDPFSSSMFQYGSTVPLTTPSLESSFTWALDNENFCRYIDRATPMYDPQPGPVNEIGVDPANVFSSDIANFNIDLETESTDSYSSSDDHFLPSPHGLCAHDFDYAAAPSPNSVSLETSVASTDYRSSIDNHVQLPLYNFYDHGSDSEATSPSSVSRKAPPPRSTRTRRTRANPRWSPSSDQTESDHDYHPHSSTRKRRASAVPPCRDVITKCRKTEKVTGKRAVDDKDLSLTMGEQPLILRCLGSLSSGCDLRFSTIEEATSHAKSHSTRNLCCPFGGCKQMFTAPGDVQRHAESLAHTPVKEHRCLTCLRSFTRIDALKRHCVNAKGGHLAIHKGRLEGGVRAVSDDEGIWTLQAPEGFSDTCETRCFAIEVVSSKDPEPRKSRK